MTFVDDIAALRPRLLGVAMHLELQPAILAMSLAMGLEGGRSLPDQVAKLVAAMGMAVDTRFLAPHSRENNEGRFLSP